MSRIRPLQDQFHHGRYPVLGPTDTRITEIYAERDVELAIKVMKQMG